MARGPKITSIEVHEFKFEKLDIARHEDGGIAYSPGARSERTAYAIRILTDTGPVGEFVGGMPADYAALPSFVDFLIGTNALQREWIYTRVGHATRMNRVGLAPIDIALWDLAGKYHGAPIHQLLGGYKETLPTYVATLHGEEGRTGGLDSPESYADFAQQCLEAGYPGYKIHGWENGHVPPRNRDCPQGRRARGRQNGHDARPLQRARHIRRRREAGESLRRGRVLLVRRPLPRHGYVDVRAPQAAPANQDSPPDK